MPGTATTPTGAPLLSPSLIAYLRSIGLDDAALAQLLDAAAGGLLGAVPPAGEYITSLDYETLYPALASQYVGEVIQEYEAQLGNADELYAAAVEAGYMTAEQAAAAKAQAFSRPGALEAKFGAQGGIRALAGPYQAARTEILQQALADMQMAAQKASTDAYTMANKTTDSRINALSNAGQLGLGLTNAGVSRRNAQGAAEAMGEMPGEGAPMEIPLPPKPDEPSLWEKILPGLITAGGAAGLAWLTRPRADDPEEAAQKSRRYKDEQKRLDDEAAAEANTETQQQRLSSYHSEEHGPPQDEGTYGTPYNPFQSQPSVAMGGGMPQWQIAEAEPAATSYSWQNHNYQQPQATPQSVQWAQPQYDDPGYYDVNYGGNYNSSGGYTGGWSQPSYDYGTSYQGDYGYNYDYDYGSYDPYSWSGDSSSGYWV